MTKRFNLKDYKTCIKGTIRWIAPKKHTGSYPCDEFITFEGRKILRKPIKCTKDTILFKILMDKSK